MKILYKIIAIMLAIITVDVFLIILKIFVKPEAIVTPGENNIWIIVALPLLFLTRFFFKKHVN